MVKELIRVYGTVQGVGFRPTVYRLAKACGLRGDVFNDGQGVVIRALGSEVALGEFVQRLQQECPPLAKINQLIRIPYTGELELDDFVISPSIPTQVNTEITPDAATCPQCLKDIFDPLSRFYRYPLTNCTHCGPRLSIICGIPYDRDNTSMSSFPMCSKCKDEYQDIENRRFHAQATACHVCGPHAWLERVDQQPITSSMFSQLDDVDAVCTLLQKGEIFAIKGLSGFHLVCDATQETVVQKLRQRKQRDRKPLALMARDINIIAEYCQINSQEADLLTSPAAPIVILAAQGKKKVAVSVAPGQNTLGFILPYTPLHHLILKRMNRPVVFTSGNIAGEPQCIDNQVARRKLGKIVDYFLFHNRDIIHQVDDSVVRVVGDRIRTIRRGRGYAPTPIDLPPEFNQAPAILAMGGELKNTFCLLREGKAILSQHLGDLDRGLAFQAYQKTLNLYLNLFEHQPEIISIDQHPEYLSTKLGKDLANTDQIQLDQIQHHHAHIAACMAENQLPLNTAPVLGIAFDGLGYGEDGTFWGGEIILADYRKFRRLATFKQTPMIGGKQAVYQPWRNTYSHLITAFDWAYLKQNYHDLEIFRFLEKKPLNLLNQMIKQGINSPSTSSVGRLFDGVAAAMGLCREECSYEGQAAIEMESLVDLNILNNLDRHPETINYHFDIKFSDNSDFIYSIDSAPMWKSLLDDLQQQVPLSIIAAKFHQGLANAIVKIVKRLGLANQFEQVALSGGVFQNAILLELVIKQLQKLGINVITHSITPTNDGGLSLGQAVITAARSINA
jgi:hydrogenase maturation protein HypF